MRGHDQNSRCAPVRAWPALILGLLVAHPLGLLRGQDVSAPAPLSSNPRETDAIDLAARSVRVWNAGGARWVHLSGRSALLQGVEGLRAEEILARISAAPGPAGTVYRVEAYAEGLGPLEERSSRRGTARVALQTSEGVKLRSYDPAGLVELDAAPARLGLLGRSGLAAIRAPTADPRPPTQRGPSDGSPSLARPSLVPATSPLRDRNLASPEAATVVLPATSLQPTVAEHVGQSPKLDVATMRTQLPGPIEVTDDPVGARDGGIPPPAAPPILDSAPTVPSLPPTPAPRIEAIPEPARGRAGPNGGRTRPAEEDLLPITPGTQRITRISPLNGGANYSFVRLPVANATDTVVIKGGVNIVTESPQFGIIDISADNAVIWRRIVENGRGISIGPNGEEIDDAEQPMEVYLEGNVVVRQDERKVQGNGDQKTYRAKQAFYDLQSERFIGIDAEVNMFAPGLIAPMRVNSPRIEQFRPLETASDGSRRFGLAQIRADRTVSTGSRFPNPGYRFNSSSVDMYRVQTDETNPNTGKPVADPADPNPPQDLTWRIDARQNVFFLGFIPVFYWPRFVANADDLEPPLRQFGFRTNNYFGQQVLSDWNGFRLLSIEKPKWVDIWNVDLDYLSARTKEFPALGSEIGWNGGDLFNDLSDPYGKVKGKSPSITRDYFGYFDLWGLRDFGNDILGSGPAVITNNIAAGNAGYQRGGGGPKGSVPPFQDFRGRVSLRHMQRFLPDDEEHVYEDLRAQLEIGFYSDRNFLEEYYKRLFDVGLDQEVVGYLIRQKENRAWTLWAEANLQSWQTETQWFPRLDYYRLGDSLLGNRLTYFTHTGVDYANVHTAAEVNNPHIFAFIPFDPISNTSGVWKSGRAYTNHELDLPLNFSNIFRLVPYVQGQAVGWTQQIDGQSTGRVWGAAGARAEMMAWKAYPWVQSELLNVHGLNHKINVEADFRDAYSKVKLNRIGVQDDLDDNTYEYVRRYFALTNYAGGILPAQYDPRHLILRRAISPITGSSDIQASIETLHLGLHQRLQTKRGPDGKRRIIDYMTLDFDTTYFPFASRDNFGKPFGQNMYNWQWFVGDRTSIISYGWFEFWNLTGNPIFKTNVSQHLDPFGLNVVTSGINVTRPPRGNVFIGYSVIDTGPITTSALNLSSSYWLSPKWYGSFSTMYDFGNAILLGSFFSVTRVGADYLTTVGLTVDPQRQSYMFAFAIAPRLSPNMRFGSGTGSTLDTRYAPTE